MCVYVCECVCVCVCVCVCNVFKLCIVHHIMCTIQIAQFNANYLNTACMDLTPQVCHAMFTYEGTKCSGCLHSFNQIL